MVLSLLLSVNVKAEGCIEGDCDNGTGTYIFSDGGKYSGQWKNLRQHGKGSATLATGSTYEGDWNNGLISGKGIYTWAPGTGGPWKKYDGSFVNHKKHGVGILTYIDGRTFNVVFNNDNLEKEKLIIVKEKKEKPKSSPDDNKIVSAGSGSSATNKIAQSKQICKDLGFKANTEKFADCALKMMSMQFEATNKVTSSGGTKQEIVVKHKNDYDIWDALLDTSALLRNNNTSNSSSSSGTNCKVYQREWGADMVCR